MPGNSLESPTQCAEEAETVAGAAVPKCAACALGSRLGTSLGENRLPTYHLSPLWSETKQLESSVFRKSKCESQGRPGRSPPVAALTTRENAADCPPCPLRRRADYEQTQPGHLLAQARQRFPSYPVPECHSSPSLKEWGWGGWESRLPWPKTPLPSLA